MVATIYCDLKGVLTNELKLSTVSHLLVTKRGWCQVTSWHLNLNFSVKYENKWSYMGKWENALLCRNMMCGLGHDMILVLECILLGFFSLNLYYGWNFMFLLIPARLLFYSPVTVEGKWIFQYIFIQVWQLIVDNYHADQRNIRMYVNISHVVIHSWVKYMGAMGFCSLHQHTISLRRFLRMNISIQCY